MNENPKHAVARSTAGDRTRPHARPARHPELSATLLVRAPRVRTRAELARGPADARRLAAAFSGGLHAYVVASGDLVADVAAVARVLHEGAPYAPARDGIRLAAAGRGFAPTPRSSSRRPDGRRG